MKLELRGRFYLEVLLCMATSDIKFSEHNELTQASRRLISYEFPRDLDPSISDVCFFIEGFYKHQGRLGKKAASNFIRAFARKDPDKFQELLNDQSKPIHFRKFRMKKGIDALVLSIASIYDFEPTDDLKI